RLTDRPLTLTNIPLIQSTGIPPSYKPPASTLASQDAFPVAESVHIQGKAKRVRSARGSGSRVHTSFLSKLSLLTRSPNKCQSLRLSRSLSTFHNERRRSDPSPRPHRTSKPVKPAVSLTPQPHAFPAFAHHHHHLHPPTPRLRTRRRRTHIHFLQDLLLPAATRRTTPAPPRRLLPGPIFRAPLALLSETLSPLVPLLLDRRSFTMRCYRKPRKSNYPLGFPKMVSPHTAKKHNQIGEGRQIQKQERTRRLGFRGSSGPTIAQRLGFSRSPNRSYQALKIRNSRCLITEEQESLAVRYQHVCYGN
ncbi:hypothetical protein R3P38DRAFT_1633320, partial [Favolaschia claudopus]